MNEHSLLSIHVCQGVLEGTFTCHSLLSHNKQCSSKQTNPEKLNDLLKFIQKVQSCVMPSQASSLWSRAVHTTVFPPAVTCDRRQSSEIKMHFCGTTMCMPPLDGL